MNVGYEYMEAEKCRKAGDIGNAIKHYEAAIENYNNADNEYMLSPGSSYTIEDTNGEKIQFPSVNKMVSKSFYRLEKIKRKAKNKRPNGLLTIITSLFGKKNK